MRCVISKGESVSQSDNLRVTVATLQLGRYRVLRLNNKARAEVSYISTIIDV